MQPTTLNDVTSGGCELYTGCQGINGLLSVNPFTSLEL